MADQPQVLGVVNSYQDLHRIMRDQATALELSREVLDEIAGVQRGYSGKLLAPKPIRRLGEMAFSCILPALGIQLVAFADDEALAQISTRRVKRNAGAASRSGADFNLASAFSVESDARAGRTAVNICQRR